MRVRAKEKSARERDGVEREKEDERTRRKAGVSERDTAKSVVGVYAR